jgi:hypothetical protein
MKGPPKMFFITREDYNGEIMFFLEHVNYSTKFSCIQIYFMSKVVAEATLEALQEEDSESIFLMHPLEDLPKYKEYLLT